MKKENIVCCTCLVAANLLETKVVQLGPISVTAGLIVFPVSYIINDCIAEVWGFRKARLIIWMGFLMNFMVVAMNKMPGVVCPIPKGAFYSIVKLPVDDAEKFAQWLLEEFDYNGQTVMLAPASGFYYTPGLGKNEVRIAYVLKISDLQKAMEILSVALKTYPGKTL